MNLKPCPHCGGEAVSGHLLILCSNQKCGMTGPIHDQEGHKWNALPRRGDSGGDDLADLYASQHKNLTEHAEYMRAQREHMKHQAEVLESLHSQMPTERTLKQEFLDRVAIAVLPEIAGQSATGEFEGDCAIAWKYADEMWAQRGKEGEV